MSIKVLTALLVAFGLGGLIGLACGYVAEAFGLSAYAGLIVAVPASAVLGAVVVDRAAA